MTYTIKTPCNMDIRYELETNTEENHSNGWQIDSVLAYDGDVSVGYLKMANISREQYDKYYASIFNWMTSINHNYVIPAKRFSNDHSGIKYRKSRTRHYTELTKYEMFKLLSTIYYLLDDNDALSNMCEIDLSETNVHDDLLLRIRKAEQDTLNYSKYGPQFKKFHDMYVDKPIIDFVLVMPEYQRKGIATMLHKIAALYTYNTKGLYLYAANAHHNKAYKSLLTELRNDHLLIADENNSEYFNITLLNNKDL